MLIQHRFASLNLHPSLRNCGTQWTGFEELMIKWLDDPKLRQYALQNSLALAGNQKYAAAAMKAFDPKNKDKAYLQYFMPVFCATDNAQGEKAVKAFLTGPGSPDDLVLYQKAFKALCQYKPSGFPEEIKVFLDNHRKDELMMKSSVYPMALYCLCKSGDAAGYKGALEYIAGAEAVLKEKQDQNPKRLFMAVFFQYAPQYRKLEEFKQAFQEKLAALEKARAIVKKDEPKK